MALQHCGCCTLGLHLQRVPVSVSLPPQDADITDNFVCFCASLGVLKVTLIKRKSRTKGFDLF